MEAEWHRGTVVAGWASDGIVGQWWLRGEVGAKKRGWGLRWAQIGDPVWFMWHYLRSELELDLPLAEVFDFFSRAENLERITPSNLGFQILTPTPIKMERDILIDYRISLHGLPMRWRTLISAWQPPYEFVDEQLIGPYHSWIHRHTFREVSSKTTAMEDYVRYKLPLTPFGEIGIFYVKPQVEGIFRHRNAKIAELLNCTARAGKFESK